MVPIFTVYCTLLSNRSGRKQESDNSTRCVKAFFRVQPGLLFSNPSNELEDPLPDPIKYFVPAQDKLPEILGSRQTILDYSSESRNKSFVDTIISYIESLQDIYTMWQVGIIDNTLASSQGSDFEMQYPLSPQQRGVLKRYYSLVQASQCSIYGTWNSAHIPATNQDPHNESEDHKKHQLPLGSPGSEKTQVVKCLVHYQKRDVL